MSGNPSKFRKTMIVVFLGLMAVFILPMFFQNMGIYDMELKAENRKGGSVHAYVSAQRAFSTIDKFYSPISSSRSDFYQADAAELKPEGTIMVKEDDVLRISALECQLPLAIMVKRPFPQRIILDEPRTSSNDPASILIFDYQIKDGKLEFLGVMQAGEKEA